MITIDRNSFIEESKNENEQLGTVVLTIGGDSRRVKALASGKQIFAYGIEGCYRTGQKWWSGCVHLSADEKYMVWFGRCDNHPKFNKNNIRFKEAA